MSFHSTLLHGRLGSLRAWVQLVIVVVDLVFIQGIIVSSKYNGLHWRLFKGWLFPKDNCLHCSVHLFCSVIPDSSNSGTTSENLCPSLWIVIIIIFFLSFFLLANHHLCLWSLGPMVTDHETHEQEIGNDRNLWKKFKRVWVSLLAVDVPHSPSTWKRSNLEEEITLSPIFAANTIIIGNINTCSAFQTLFPSCLIV